MNEEEIIKILTDEDMYWNYPEKQVLKATRKLLDLYNQEKEKNKKIKNELRKLQDNNLKFKDSIVFEYIKDILQES